MIPAGTRVRTTDREIPCTGTVIRTPVGYFNPRQPPPGYIVFVAWDHLRESRGGGWTPEDYKLLEVIS